MARIEKLIFDQADRNPNAVAVEYNGAQLSYSELKRQSLQISQALREFGVEPGWAVGICQNRSLATIPLLLGVWNAGGVVVPINPNAPVKMLEWIIQHSSLRVIVTESNLERQIVNAVTNIGANSAPVILAEELRSNGHAREKIYNLSDAFRRNGGGVTNNIDLEDICYIIYTSGSQGHPKGVIGSHEGLIHYLRWQAKEFSITEADRFSQTAPLSFDFSLKELLVPLISGACVCIADRATVIDPRKFLEWVGGAGITIMCCVPTLLRSILQASGNPGDDRAFQYLRYVLISGDMLRWDDVISWRGRFGSTIPLYNLYGPTESTIIKLFYPIPDTRCLESVNVPVGRPIQDADVLILDEHDQPCSTGRVGEIVILSEWIARGYVNGDQAGNRSFCHLFHNGERTRAYRTGDLGRLLSSGDVELIGRKDRQVKIRGYRIELDEIECVLSEHSGIRDVAVIAPNGSNNTEADSIQMIACYFTANQPGVTEKEIRDYAKERLLPQVLSLTQFSRLDELPLTANGKVDRLRLESLIKPNGSRSLGQAPQVPSTVQQRILAMWEELLALDRIELGANFFELGGDSMTAIRLLRRLREELFPEIKLGDVYNYPSVSELSERVTQLLKGGNVENEGAHV
jgi:amino acid adenylation domain-containing protein